MFESNVFSDSWEKVYKAKEGGYSIPAQVVGQIYVNNLPTWEVLIEDDVRGIIPAEQTGVDPKLMSQFVGQQIYVKVKGADKEEQLFACSRKEAVEEYAERLNFKAEQVISVVVRGFLPRTKEKSQQLVVDVGGGVLVEIPRKQAVKWAGRSLREQYPLGAQIKAKVVELAEDNTIALSVKAALPDPWLGADFRRGSFISGRVVGVRDKHIFIEPDKSPGIVALANRPLAGEVRPGSKVTCVVATFVGEEKKLRLRLKGW